MCGILNWLYNALQQEVFKLSYPHRIGVILDAWMYTLKDEPDMPGSIKQPLIFINTETFHINSNISTMQKFLEAPHNAERHLYTIRYSLQNFLQCIKEIYGCCSLLLDYFSSPSFTFCFEMQENNSWKSNRHSSYSGLLVRLVYEKDWPSTSLKDQSCSYFALFTKAHRWEIQ